MNEILAARDEVGVQPEVAAPATPPRKSSFGGDLIRLVSGTAFAQAVTILTTPILTRLFAPDAYGLSVAFVSITSILAVLVCLRYEQAILLPAQDEEAANVAALSLAATVVTSALTWLVFALWGGAILAWLNMPELEPLGWAIPLTLLVGGALFVLTQWNMRKRRFANVSVNNVISATTITGGRIGVGFAGWNGGGALIVMSLAGSAIAALLLALRTWRDDWRIHWRSVSLAGMAQSMRRYADLPLFGTWATLLNTISWQLPVFLLAAYFGPAVAGQYALGNRLVKLPMSLIGNSIGQVFFQRAAETKNRAALAPMAEGIFRRLVSFGLPPMLFLTVVGRDLFALVFGPEWAEAGVYMQILAVWAFFWFISSPLGTLFVVLEKQRFALGWNIVNFVTRFLALWVGGQMQSSYWALGFFSVSGIIVYGYLVFWLLAAAGVKLGTVLRILAINTLTFLPVAATLLLLRAANAPLWLEVGVPGLMLAAYWAWSFRSEPRLRALLGRVRRSH